VPNDFANGLLFPILKGGDLDNTVIENYRGITVSCMLSKLFEQCLSRLFSDYLFLPNCSLVLNPMSAVGRRSLRPGLSLIIPWKMVVRQLYVLWISPIKAFDKVDYFYLFLKLMNRCRPYSSQFY